MTASWWNESLYSLDTETTGTDPEEARVVTAALVLVRPEASVLGRSWLVDPGIVIPDEAAAVHGVTTEKARAEGMDAAEAIGQILDAVRTALTMTPLVVMNAAYDLTVLDREARRHGLQPLDPFPVIDPLVLDKQLDRYRRGSRRLDALCAQYGIKLDDAHEAWADAVAAAQLVRAIGRIQPYPPPGDMHDHQIRWKREQALSLIEYGQRVGKDYGNVRTEWPVVPWNQ